MNINKLSYINISMLRADKDHIIDLVVTTINVIGENTPFIVAGDSIFKNDVTIEGDLTVTGNINGTAPTIASNVQSDPFAPVTATNVQDAIDQLAALVSTPSFNDQYLEIYDSVGGLTIPSGISVDIPFDTQEHTNTNYSHTTPSAVVTFNVAGTYKVEYKATTQITSGFLRTNTEFKLQIDTGGGFVDVPQSKSNITNRTTGAGPSTVQSTNFITVSVGDDLKLVAEKIVGPSTVETVAEQTNLVINRMD